MHQTKKIPSKRKKKTLRLQKVKSKPDTEKYDNNKKHNKEITTRDS